MEASVDNELLTNIIKNLEEVKSKASSLYKKIQNANSEEDRDILIGYYKDIIKVLNEIKEKSHSLDKVEVDPICFDTDDNFNKELFHKYNNIMSLAQHIRGCKQSFDEYNKKIETNNK